MEDIEPPKSSNFAMIVEKSPLLRARPFTPDSPELPGTRNNDQDTQMNISDGKPRKSSAEKSVRLDGLYDDDK